MAEAHSPLAQFEIHRLVPIKLGSIDASFTNSALWMIIAVLLVTLLMTQGMRARALVPARLAAGGVGPYRRLLP